MTAGNQGWGPRSLLDPGSPALGRRRSAADEATCSVCWWEPRERKREYPKEHEINVGTPGTIVMTAAQANLVYEK